jgi:hypothetical protein
MGVLWIFGVVMVFADPLRGVRGFMEGKKRRKQTLLTLIKRELNSPINFHYSIYNFTVEVKQDTFNVLVASDK